MRNQIFAKMILVGVLIAPLYATGFSLDSRLRARIPSDVTFLWNGGDITTILKAMGSIGNSIEDISFVAHEDVRYQMASSLLQRLDSAFRTRFPESFVNIPSLRLEIANQSFSEFAMPASTCLPVPVIWTQTEVPARLTDTMIQIGADGRFIDGGKMHCQDLSIRAQFNRKTLKAFVAHLNLYMDPLRTSCQFSIEGEANSMFIRAGSGCVVPPNLRAGGDGVSFLQIDSASRYLMITAETLKNYPTQEALAGLIAHEMLHLYLVHMMLPGYAEKSSYFYRLSEPRTYHQAPVRVAEFELIGRKVREISFKYDHSDSNGLKSAEERIALNDGIESEDLKLIRQATDLGIGYFTDEQEADELSIEILEAAGFNLEQAMDKYRFSTRKTTYWDRNCNLWSDLQKGRSVPYLFGFADEHHDRCFRLFNARKLIDPNSRYE